VSQSIVHAAAGLELERDADRSDRIEHRAGLRRSVRRRAEPSLREAAAAADEAHAVGLVRQRRTPSRRRAAERMKEPARASLGALAGATRRSRRATRSIAVLDEQLAEGRMRRIVAAGASTISA
jgi:hypothetical protein